MNDQFIQGIIFDWNKIDDDSYLKQIEALKDDRYNWIVICDESVVVGILLYWEFDKYKYIEHLAIYSELRGKSYGSKILEIFCRDNKTIILEIDPPIDEIALKRLKFYSKIGFMLQEFNHIDPPYRKGRFVNLFIFESRPR